MVTNLQSDIELKKEIDKELTDKLEIFIQRLTDLKSFKMGEFEIVCEIKQQQQQYIEMNEFNF